ncbi:alanine dehydrogenase [Lewinellaceae bacterium SD302]|nr:alanine dehydrogenase [Lewinellaceae bacterium SD302]
MNSRPKIALIREEKTPPDSRVALTPKQAAKLLKAGWDITVQPSPRRAFKDEEYVKAGLPLVEDISDRDLLLGIKEVPIDNLIPNKTYCFFAHVIKEQPYNQKLLLALLEKNIRHVDYEVLTDELGNRLIAFGYFAGMVGAHNGVWAYGKRTGKFELPRMNECFDYEEAKSHYDRTKLPEMRVVLTGTGRVGKGAAQVLKDLGLRKVSPKDYLRKDYPGEAIFTQVSAGDYAEHQEEGDEFNKQHFYDNPREYKSKFQPYLSKSDVFINGVYWDNDAPTFFTREDMQRDDFRIQTVADVTCDIAPVASVPTTLKASTIADPVFGYDPVSNEEKPAFSSEYVDVMSIDNLPSELPRDASKAFGEMFIERILPAFEKQNSPLLVRATVTLDGELGPNFQYLVNYRDGK